MFQKKDEHGYKQAVEKITRKTLVYGKKTLLSEFRLEKGASLPSHNHPHEQTGYLVSGHIDLTIGQETHEVEPGDSWCIPGNIDHSAAAHKDSVVVEVFSPVREDFIP